MTEQSKITIEQLNEINEELKAEMDAIDKALGLSRDVAGGVTDVACKAAKLAHIISELADLFNTVKKDEGATHIADMANEVAYFVLTMANALNKNARLEEQYSLGEPARQKALKIDAVREAVVKAAYAPASEARAARKSYEVVNLDDPKVAKALGEIDAAKKEVLAALKGDNQ